MKFGFFIVLLSFAAFAFPGFAEEVPAPKESLPCELGYEALYERAHSEVGPDRKNHGWFSGQIEYVWGRSNDLAYTFTRPSHPAYPAAFRRQRYWPQRKFQVDGCSYGDKAAFEKLLHEIEEEEQRWLDTPPPFGASTAF